jgi:hydroxyacylglutathione hydrolase
VTDAPAPVDHGIRSSECTVGSARIVTVMTGAPWRENCHVVIDTASGEAIVIDPGDRAEGILAVVASLDVHVGAIALTHGHHDHVGAVAAVCRAFELPCLVHDADLRLVRQAPLWAFRFAGKKIETPAPLASLPASVSAGNTVGLVMHTPGHTPGGVSFLFDGFAVTGDTLLYQHVGRTDLPGASAPTLRRSVTSLLGALTDGVILFAGHGRPWTVGEAKHWWSDVGEAPPALDEHRDLS